MVAISTTPATSLPLQDKQAATPSAATSPTTPAPTESSANAFGSATELNLSPPAQAIVAGQSSSQSGSGASGTTSSAGSGASGKSGTHHRGGRAHGGGHIATSSSGSATATLIEDAKREVTPLVGVTGADEVVDNKGNISRVKLAELEAQQTEKTNQ